MGMSRVGEKLSEERRTLAVEAMQVDDQVGRLVRALLGKSEEVSAAEAVALLRRVEAQRIDRDGRWRVLVDVMREEDQEDRCVRRSEAQHIMEHITDVMGIEEAKQVMEDYDALLKQYLMHRKVGGVKGALPTFYRRMKKKRDELEVALSNRETATQRKELSDSVGSQGEKTEETDAVPA